MEPYINPNATAALFAPDAGNLIPYEYAIALAENAVDNGVELRIRREVASIEKHPDGSFTISANHWEPESYLNAVKSKVSETSSSLASIGIYSALTFGLVSVFARVAVLKRGIVDVALTKLLIEASKTTDALTGVAVAVVLLAFIFLKPSSSTDSRKAVDGASSIPSVGSGGRAVTVDEMRTGGTGTSSAMGGRVVDVEKIKTKFIVNCAGSAADKIANMIGDHSFKIKPRLGDYIILSREQGKFAKHTLFPCPGPLGKGVLVQTTLWGMLILGPTARDVHIPEVMAETAADIQRFILHKCRQLVPSFDPKDAIASFCGARAKSTRGDWIIEPSSECPNFILAAGIDSPGLAGSPAIALEVVDILRRAGLNLQPNPSFNPNRAPIVVPKVGWKGIKAGPVGKFTNPKENVVCKCEKVTEAEIVDAIHRSLPIDSTQAIRKRTRAGMGHCQGDAENYNCECRVADIIARETGLPVEAVGRRPWPGSGNLSKRWLKDEDRESLDQLSK